MKRTVIILLVLTILLASCVSSQPTPTDPALNDPSTPSQTYAYDPDAKPTKSTAPATKPSTEPSTEPTETEPLETEPLPILPGTPLTQKDLESYQKALESGFFNLATTTVFSQPKEINLHQLFYNGISRHLDQLTDQEFTYFSAKNEHLESIDVCVLSPDNMNRVLIKYFGITLDETSKRGLDQFQYWEETGCYYCFGTDANGNSDIQVLAGSSLSDSTVQLLYSSSGAWFDAGLSYSIDPRLWLMTLKPIGTSFQIISNLPA